MFNRAFQVKIVKDKKVKDIAADPTAPTFQEKTVIIGQTLECVIEKAGKALLAYVLVDTLRRVAVETAKK